MFTQNSFAQLEYHEIKIALAYLLFFVTLLMSVSFLELKQ